MTSAPQPSVAAVALPEFRLEQGPTGSHDLDDLSDLSMTVTVVAGTTRMPLAELLGLEPGVVVPLDRSPDATVDILINGSHAARGDVIVMDDQIAARVSELDGPR